MFFMVVVRPRSSRTMYTYAKATMQVMLQWTSLRDWHSPAVPQTRSPSSEFAPKTPPLGMRPCLGLALAPARRKSCSSSRFLVSTVCVRECVSSPCTLRQQAAASGHGRHSSRQQQSFGQVVRDGTHATCHVAEAGEGNANGDEIIPSGHCEVRLVASPVPEWTPVL